MLSLSSSSCNRVKKRKKKKEKTRHRPVSSDYSHLLWHCCSLVCISFLLLWRNLEISRVKRREKVHHHQPEGTLSFMIKLRISGKMKWSRYTQCRNANRWQLIVSGNSPCNRFNAPNNGNEFTFIILIYLFIFILMEYFAHVISAKSWD